MMQVIEMEIIARILEIAAAQGHTQQELERICALAQGRVSRWKEGKGEPTGTQLARIADTLRVPVRTLIDGAEDRPSLTAEQERILELVDVIGYQDALRRLMQPIDAKKPPAATRRPEAEVLPDAIGPVNLPSIRDGEKKRGDRRA